MPTYIVLKIVHCELATKFSTLYHVAWKPLRTKSMLIMLLARTHAHTLAHRAKGSGNLNWMQRSFEPASAFGVLLPNWADSETWNKWTKVLWTDQDNMGQHAIMTTLQIWWWQWWLSWWYTL
jgi:hypothetical protein